MMFLKLLPVFLSYLLIAAHLLRDGNLPMVAASLAFPFLLLVRRPWAARLVLIGLILAAMEWVWTANVIAQDRQALLEPWTRMAVILGSVAAFTLLSTLVFLLKSVRDRYSI